MCVLGLRSGVILCASWAHCVSQDFLLYSSLICFVQSLTVCATLHMLLAHQIIPTHEITDVFVHQDGNRLACCFRKQYAIDSFLEQLIYQGNTT